MGNGKTGKPPVGMRIGESVFCIGYLLFAFCAAVILLSGAGDYNLLAGIMVLLLAAGDSFHLVPRVIRNIRGSLNKSEFYLGLGNLISSVTMTVFYVLMFTVVRLKAGLSDMSTFDNAVRISLYILAAVRIVLCLFPDNRWFDKEGSLKWGVIRNVPFVLMGIIMVVWLLHGSILSLWNMYLLAVLIVLSFAFYVPVVLFAKKKPAVGMLMIPKTICYIVMICLFL